MLRILIVEPAVGLQREYQRKLENRLRDVQVDIVASYPEAIDRLRDSYAAYIIAGRIRKVKDGSFDHIGIDLARVIYGLENSYEKIAFASGDSNTVAKAKRMGISKSYKKGEPNSALGERSTSYLVEDLIQFLERGR